MNPKPAYYSFLKLLTLFILPAVFLMACKKKTNIHVLVYSPYLEKPTPFAAVELWEFKPTNFFTSGWGKVEDGRKIATAITDINGEAVFDEEKLRFEDKYSYRCVLGKLDFGNNCKCAEKFPIKKGTFNTFRMGEYNTGDLNMRYTGLKELLPGDSLSITLTWLDVYDPIQQKYIESDGSIHSGTIDFTYDPTYYYPSKTYAYDYCKGKLSVTIRKRKQDVVTVSYDTLHFPARPIPLIDINW